MEHNGLGVARGPYRPDQNKPKPPILWLLVGFAAGFGAAVLMVAPTLRQSGATIQALSERLQEANSAVTLLSEPMGAPPPQGVVLMEGLARLAGIPEPRFTQAAIGARWYIPAKIKPLLYGPDVSELHGGLTGPTTARYFWFDLATKKLEGPMVPERTGP